MPTLAAGSKLRSAGPALRSGSRSGGFTLLELLVVMVLIAIATAGVNLSIRDSADSALERDASRLAALLETARAAARANDRLVRWQPQGNGFAFEGLAEPGLPRQWLADTTRAVVSQAVVLGPEPLIGPQAIALFTTAHPERRLWVVTDGLRPFTVQSDRGAP